MAEVYANYNALTTLASNYGTGVGTITVGTTGAPFPQSGTFSVVITDATSNASKVLLRVTSVPSGTTFLVTPEGNDGTAASGDNVYAVLSSKSIDGVRNDISAAGAYASLPAATKNGNLYLSTDYSPYIFRDTGAVQQAWWAPNCTIPPAVGSLTGVNTSSLMTSTNVGGILYTHIADSSTLNWRILSTTAPATPYSFVVRYQAIQAFKNTQVSGIYFYDGTKLSGLEYLTQGGLTGVVDTSLAGFWRVENITNTLTDGSTVATVIGSGVVPPSPQFGPVWCRLRNDGTTLSYDYSMDGAKWNNAGTQAVGAFITPTKIGIGGVSVTSTASYFTDLSVSSWYTTATATL